MAQEAGQGGEGGPRGEGGPNIEDQSQLLPRGLVQEEETQNETRREGSAGVVPREGVGNTPGGRTSAGRRNSKSLRSYCCSVVERKKPHGAWMKVKSKKEGRRPGLPSPQAAAVKASLHEGREATTPVGHSPGEGAIRTDIAAAPAVFRQADGAGGAQGRFQDGGGPSLPSSPAAAVTASLRESRETQSQEDQLSGDKEGNKETAAAARVLPQAWKGGATEYGGVVNWEVLLNMTCEERISSDRLGVG